MAFRHSLRSISKRQCFTFLNHSRNFSSIPQIDFDSPVTLQKARTWDEGVESKFSASPLSEIFKGKRVVIFGVPGAFTGVCSKSHVPGYMKLAGRFKEKNVDSIICVSVNDPYTLNAWAEKLNALNKIDFYADFDGKFNEMLGLSFDLSGALLGKRSNRWSAFVDNGEIKKFFVETAPSDLELSKGEKIFEEI